MAGGATGGAAITEREILIGVTMPRSTDYTHHAIRFVDAVQGNTPETGPSRFDSDNPWCNRTRNLWAITCL
ncbi:hypothetical protein J7376_06205 [Paracoccus sp. R12_1]|uniref:hypothetical protein n=1 Tax=unclassified Paracoccus (in: a-proteobacteria) TaxID=2688777 RepID=UPI001ADAF2E6|nr:MULTISPECIES: hypothetical protein [unclassified Paracoccus (in: a-proteobacteria)]MBO9454554.1 hypothetical protein [Paracoccus sp. R12_2]MBO9486108.1 hypothetical protein [Paracoccus sp. R12_1]